MTGAALTQPALDWLISRPAIDTYGVIGRRVTDNHVDSIEVISAQLRKMDDQFGGGAVLGLVKSQVRFVLDLLRDHRYTSTVGMRLHGAAAELLRLAGWVSLDAGQQPARAQRLWIAALHGAHSAGDRSLGANILGFMSCQAKDLDLFGEATRLADAARQGYSGASPRVTAILNLRAAEAYARSNEPSQARAAIDTAYEAFRDQGMETTDPAWSYWLDEAQLNQQAGYCYTQLRQWEKAQTHLASAIRLQAEPVNRAGALRHTLLASTYAHQGDPDHACELANKAMDALAEDVDSARCVGDIRRVQSALAPYRKVAVVREFQARAEHLFGIPETV
jgi:tetratricopeptide (TPR) repeat protein